MDILTVVGLLTALLILTGYFKRRRYCLPPGPKGLPIIGNALDIPKEYEWHTYQKWSREFNSDILHVRVLQTDVIILNSVKAARDLLERRSNIYSHRQHTVMLDDMIGWGKSIALTGYGEKWRATRRAFHQHFRQAAVAKYRPKMVREAKILLSRLVADPDDLMLHLRTFAGSIILGVTFGMDIQPKNDPYIILAEKALHAIVVAGNVGAYLVDYFPILRYLPEWMPGANFKREAAEWRKLCTAVYEKPFQSVKQKLVNGTAEPCILTSMLMKLDPSRDNTHVEKVIRDATGSAYAAGADTTVSSLGTFILAMLLYPEVQKAAQDEIDRVVGSDRLPAYDDMSALPYLTAVVMESLRWRNVLPLGVPHKLMADDEYRGYHLPAGSIVIGNTWAMLHDEHMYPNPDVFDPTRYLTPEGKTNKNAPDPTEAAFGFGRRICPGRHLAVESIWIAVSHILATLNIEKSKDEFGKIIEPSGECTPGMMSYPVPFKASFVPRSEAALALIESTSFPDQI